MPLTPRKNLVLRLRYVPILQDLAALSLLRRWHQELASEFHMSAVRLGDANAVIASQIRRGLSVHNFLARRHSLLVLLRMPPLLENPLPLDIDHATELLVAHALWRSEERRVG